jgi:hypothetical protein
MLFADLMLSRDLRLLRLLIFEIPRLPQIDDLRRIFGLAAAEVLDDLVEAIVMLPDVFVADSPNLFYDFIAVHGRSPPIRS